MDTKKVVPTALIIVLLVAGGWFSYRWYLEMQKPNINQQMISLLSEQQGMIIKLKTDIADVERRVVAGTLKETVVVDGETYTDIKDQLLELRKNEDENKDEIKKLREVFEQRIKEFRDSADKIMVTAGDEKIVLYEDADGNLVSINEGVEIIRHRKVEPLLEPKPDLIAGQTIEEINDRFSISMLYDGDISPAVSYKVFSLKDIGFSVTAYDLENIKLGADVNYNFKGNLEIGAGVGLFNFREMQAIRDYYIRAGVVIRF